MWFFDRPVLFHFALLPARSGIEEPPFSTEDMMPSTETRCIL
jgi:hypothetical protein